MNKIQVRCIKGFGVIGTQHNIEVRKPLPGFGYAKKLYSCSDCGELFVLDLDNPALDGERGLPEDFNESCPRCHVSLRGHLMPYPNYVFLSDGVKRMDASTISYDHESSFVEEYWLIDVKS